MIGTRGRRAKMVEKDVEMPDTGELMFAAGVLAGSVGDLDGNPVAQKWLKNVFEYLIYLDEHRGD